MYMLRYFGGVGPYINSNSALIITLPVTPEQLQSNIITKHYLTRVRFSTHHVVLGFLFGFIALWQSHIWH